MGEPRLNIGNKGYRNRTAADALRPSTGPDWLDLPAEHDHHAREKGLRDGERGVVDKETLASEYRSAYIQGYRNGSWFRYAKREYRRQRDRTIFLGRQPVHLLLHSPDSREEIKADLFEQIFRPRDPNREPTAWMA